jgi:hypothetical protein
MALKLPTILGHSNKKGNFKGLEGKASGLMTIGRAACPVGHEKCGVDSNNNSMEKANMISYNH